MAAHQYPGFHDGLYPAGHAHAALEFDRVDIGFLEKPAGIFHGLLIADLVGEKGHVADNKGVGCAAAHGVAMHDALVHGHRHGARVSINTHPERISDQEHVQTGSLGELRRRKVIGSEPGNLPALLLHPIEIVDHQFFSHHRNPPPVHIRYDKIHHQSFRLRAQIPLTQDMGLGGGDVPPHQFPGSLLVSPFETIDQLAVFIPGLLPGVVIAQSQRSEPQNRIPQVADQFHAGIRFWWIDRWFRERGN